MISKKTFLRHVKWNIYNPRNLKFLFLEKIQNKISIINDESFYLFVKKLIQSNCTLNFNNKNHSCENLEFHEKFGWICKSGKLYAFLGKIDLSDSKTFLRIGRNSYISGESIVSGTGILDIGSFVCIGENFRAVVENDNHSFDKVGYIDFTNNKRLGYEGLNFGKKGKKIPGQIIIGNNCWIGRNVTMKNNIIVGNDTCIAESSLVRSGQHLRGNHLYAGIPAIQKKIIRKKEFEPKKWWNWNKKCFFSNKKIFLSFQNCN